MQFASLIQVNVAANSNKFYKMTQTDSNTFKVEFGRVGSNGQSATYPMAQWETKLKEKLKKGYSDVTDNTTLKTDVSMASSGIPVTAIADPDVRELIDKLRKYSAQAVAANYTVTVVAVTQSAIDKAQKLINEVNGQLTLNCNIELINHYLVSLYGVIPRKIANVSKAIVQFDLDDQDKLDRWKEQMEIEQALLDAMSTQVHLATSNGNAGGGTKTVISILDQLGLDISIVSASQVDMLKKLMGDSVGKYVKAFAVKNLKTQSKFDANLASAADKTAKSFFHGSRAENWYSILENGLALHPNAKTTGKLFGHGIYFASDADKSLGYINGGKWAGGASTESWLAVYHVHVGNTWRLSKTTPNFKTGELTYADLQAKGKYDSLWAAEGYNYSEYSSTTRLRKNEIIVYKEEQNTIQYLIQVS